VAQYLDKPARKDCWRVRYTEGPGDRSWMEEKDRNYLMRQRREERERRERMERREKEQRLEMQQQRQIAPITPALEAKEFSDAMCQCLRRPTE